jgi:hypothetical protein
MLTIAAIITIAIGLVHSYFGEKYILIRLFKRDLPKLFGGDWFTKRVLRFAWHITTIAWFGLAAILLAVAYRPEQLAATTLYIVCAVFAISGVVAFVFSKGRHYSWIAFWAIAALSCYVASGY